MSDYRIAYTRPEDGGVSIVIPAEEARGFVDVFPEHPYPTGPRRPETNEEFLARIAFKDVPEGVPATLVATASLPSNRHFRGAWRLDFEAAQVGVDMPLAREAHRENIRAARDRELKNLDTGYMRADEQSDSQAKSEIATQKQALRDLPQDPAIDDAATPEALLASWPELLQNPYSAGPQDRQ